MQTPAELGVAAVLVGAAGVVALVQLVAALGHGWDAVHLPTRPGRLEWNLQLNVGFILHSKKTH